jgi:hypothetical protein
MKVLMFMFTILGLTALTVSAQTAPSTDEAGLKIMRVGLQRTAAKGPSLRAVASTDPGSQSRAKTDRVQDGNSDSNPALHRLSQDAEIAPKTSKQDPLGNMSSPYPVIYVASVVVKNIGTKTVIAVHWEYLLFEVGGTDPVKRYRVQSKRTIAPGEQAELTREVTPKGHEQQARLTRIEYADGSVWQAKP